MKLQQGNMKKLHIVQMVFLVCALCPLAAQMASTGSLSYAAGEHPLLLNSGWERFEGFIDPEQQAPGAGRSVSAPIEKGFSGALRSGDRAQGEDRAGTSGPATYRLNVLLRSPGDRRYSLLIPSLSNFKSVLINSVPVYEEGQSSASPELQFMAPAGPLSIVLQLKEGGQAPENPGFIPRFILLGDSGSLERYEAWLICFIVGQCVFLLIAAIFSSLLYWNGQRNSAFLGFSFYMLASAFFCFARQSSLFGIFPAVAALVDPVYIASLDLNMAAFILFSRSLLPRKLPRFESIWIYAFYAVSALLAVLCIFLPQRLCLVYLLSGVFYLVYGIGISVFLVGFIVKGDRSAVWLLPFMILGFFYTLLHRIYPNSLDVALMAEPAGFSLLAFFIMLLLVRRVDRGFVSLEIMSDHSRDMEKSLKRFIPLEFLECLNKKDIVDLKLGDHVKRDMTIFFSDIRSFTELSERLTVEENFNFINSYLSRMVPLVNQNGGFVDKYIGDGIMALFAGDNGADQAIKTAIEMQSKIVEYNGHRKKSGYRPISMGVGIHTGTLMLGVIGVDDRMENTVISDAVNLSSRLQAITKAFNISLAISEQTFKQLADPGSYKYRFIGKVRVKGKSAPVSVFEIFDGIAPELFERKMKANTYFEQGMLTYYQKEFGEAMYYFRRVLDINPDDGAASFYLGACIDKATV